MEHTSGSICFSLIFGKYVCLERVLQTDREYVFSAVENVRQPISSMMPCWTEQHCQPAARGWKQKLCTQACNVHTDDWKRAVCGVRPGRMVAVHSGGRRETSWACELFFTRYLWVYLLRGKDENRNRMAEASQTVWQNGPFEDTLNGLLCWVRGLLNILWQCDNNAQPQPAS